MTSSTDASMGVSGADDGHASTRGRCRANAASPFSALPARVIGQKRLDLPIGIGGGRGLVRDGGAVPAGLELVLHLFEHGLLSPLDVEVVIRAGVDDDRDVGPSRRHGLDHLPAHRRGCPVVGAADQDEHRTDDLLVHERLTSTGVDADGGGESDGGSFTPRAFARSRLGPLMTDIA